MYRIYFLLFLVVFFSLSILFLFEKDKFIAVEDVEYISIENTKSILLQVSLPDNLDFNSFLMNSNELNARILFFSKTKEFAIIEISTVETKENVLIKTKRKFLDSSISIISNFSSESFDIRKPIIDNNNIYFTD